MPKYKIVWRRMDPTCDREKVEQDDSASLCSYRDIHTARWLPISISASSAIEAEKESWEFVVDYLKANADNQELKNMVGWGRSHWINDPPECTG